MGKTIYKSKYKGVSQVLDSGKYIVWRTSGSINGRKFTGTYSTEKEAAIQYDKKMIENGKEPVNILKKTT